MSKIDMHSTICGNLTALYERKNHDYGDSFSRNYAEYGVVYPIIHMQEKLDRIKALSKADAKVSESLVDTLMDLANYAIMTLVEMTGEHASPVKPMVKCAKNNHDEICVITRPKCLCNTCANDCKACCTIDGNCPCTDCPDYVKEDASDHS